MKLRAFMTVISVAATAVGASACGSSSRLTGEAVAASPGTQARVYYAFNAAGRPAIRVTRTVRGWCIGGSSNVVRSDAWRCFAGRFIYDPCFSSGKAKGIVLCSSGAWNGYGAKINLTKALPKKYGHKRGPSKTGAPWSIQTKSGLKCTFRGSGAGIPTVGNRRANYSCVNSRYWLWGMPERKTKPWTIYIAPIKDRPPYYPRTVTRKTKIRIAWF